ncbi:YkgJ family cysteine cluster protein [Aeromicrobium sp.]|nr:YkgJ family cysteine cluster protein [Candidatus Saccharibacteria bacterium]
MKEIACNTCSGVCCIGPRALELTDAERDQLAAAGTALIQIVIAAKHTRPAAPYPAAGIPLNPERPDIFQRRMLAAGETAPLKANHGLHIMLGRCGNLVRDDSTGQEVCGAYDDRPGICREFEEAGPRCAEMRQEAGIDDPPLLKLEALFSRLQELNDN